MNGNCTNVGLSPRARGNPQSSCSDNSDTGSIPACAGEPHRISAAEDCMHRSIPACAGEPRGQLTHVSHVGVYPRVRGGTRFARLRSVPLRGLSPRARGNHAAVDASTNLRGSIPACAGEPPRMQKCALCGQVYPRVRGGTCPAIRPGCQMKGLSPRARGNLWRDYRQRHALRSIPACAGEPVLAERLHVKYGVYPRVRGGTASYSARLGTLRGLSPRARGNPIARARHRFRRRSIPACAGEP